MCDLNNRCFELTLVKTLAILLHQPFDVYFSVASVCRRWMQTLEEHSFRRRIKFTAKGEIWLFTCIQTTTYNLFHLLATLSQFTPTAWRRNLAKRQCETSYALTRAGRQPSIAVVKFVFGKRYEVVFGEARFL